MRIVLEHVTGAELCGRCGRDTGGNRFSYESRPLTWPGIFYTNTDDKTSVKCSKELASLQPMPNEIGYA
jgi:hypothetical protein